MEKFTHPFKPIIDNESQILVLGTFPSLDSFKFDFYYAHKRNQFWKLLGETFQMPTETKAEKIALLKKHKIALWDIIKSCSRKNSSDANLKEIELNDIPSLLAKFPKIEKVAFTGKKAQRLYNKRYKDFPIETFLLPSPSPAYATMQFQQKVQHYKEFFTMK